MKTSCSGPSKVVCGVTVLLLCTGIWGQAISEEVESEVTTALKSKMRQTVVSVDFQEAPMEDVIKALSEQGNVDMIKSADWGILFRPPKNVVAEFPELTVTTTYEELKVAIEHILKNGC